VEKKTKKKNGEVPRVRPGEGAKKRAWRRTRHWSSGCSYMLRAHDPSNATPQ
jgi:hypothetical protein